MGLHSNPTTHMEAKSGYGLSTESELKLWEIPTNYKNGHLPSLDITWSNDIQQVHQRNMLLEILSEQFPSVLEQGFARSADVFCEPGWFDIEESEQILRASREGGLALRMHIDELKDGGGGELAVELKVDTADHAHYTSDDAHRYEECQCVNRISLRHSLPMGADWPKFNHVTEMDVP